MKTKHYIQISITCRDAAEMQRAKEAVMYHLETLNPKLKTNGKKLTFRVVPIDPQLFEPEEACDIIRQTIAQSLTFITGWKCELLTINN